MKQILTLLLICLGFELQAQVIIFDYASKTYSPVYNDCVKQGSTVSYRIININTFAKKVLISSNIFSLNTDMPTEIATLFRIKTDDADKNLDNTQKQVEKMEDVKAEADENAKEAKTSPVKALTIAAQEANNLVEDCKDYYMKAQKVKDALNFPQIIARTLANEYYNNEGAMTVALNNEGVNSAAINRLKTDFQNFTAAYSKVYEQYEKTADAAHNAKNDGHEAKIESAQEQVQKDYDALSKQYEVALDSISSLFVKAISPANYIVTSDPIDVEDDTDEVEFQIQIGGPKDDFNKITPFKKRLKVSGGLKIDYSVGLALKFISDDQFFFDDDKKLQQQSKNNALTPGITSMIHFYPRTSKGVAFGGMFGINADFKEITDINLGFLAGPSIILGRSQKIILSGGISFSKVSRLKDGEYKIGTVYNDTKIEDVTNKILQPSWFCSFSYSITKRNVVKP